MALKVQQIYVNLFGLITSVKFYKVKFILEDLQSKKFRRGVPVLSKITCEALMESEWEDFVGHQKQINGQLLYRFRDTVLVFCNQKLIGGFRKFCVWCEKVFNYIIKPFPLQFFTCSINAMRGMLKNANLFVYLDFANGNEFVGRMIFELFTNIAPKTCENFRGLCTGEFQKSCTEKPLHYKNTVIHRIVRNGWIQGGDILYGEGNSGESIYGITFEDESFALSHNRRGVLGMANEGRPNTNGSQFYITLAPNKWMNRKCVAFGQMVSGCKALRTIENMRTVSERPIKAVRIVDCGVCTLKEIGLTDLSFEDVTICLPERQNLDVPIKIDVPVFKTSRHLSRIEEEGLFTSLTRRLFSQTGTIQGASDASSDCTTGDVSPVSDFNDEDCN